MCSLLVTRIRVGRSFGSSFSYIFFFFNDPATTEIYTLSLHDALPIFGQVREGDLELSIDQCLVAVALGDEARHDVGLGDVGTRSEEHTSELQSQFHLVCRLLLEKKKKTK